MVAYLNKSYLQGKKISMGTKLWLIKKVAVTHLSHEMGCGCFVDCIFILFCLTGSWSQRNLIWCWHSVICLCPTGEQHGLAFSTRSFPRCQGNFLSLHGHDTHLFLCPAISASPWLQKVDVTVESVVGKGFWSIFRVVIWLWEVEEGKFKPYMLLYFTEAIPTIIYVFIK